MKIKIRNKIYDSEKEPIMFIFQDLNQEKGLIKNLEKMNKNGLKKYCEFPDIPKWSDNKYKKIDKWMDDIQKKSFWKKIYKFFENLSIYK